MPSPSKLEKLTIYSYKDAAFSQSAADPYSVLINPEKYTHNYVVNYNQEQSPGTAAPSPKFEKMGSEKVSMELVFDATGLIPGSSGDVLKDIAAFKAIAYDYNGSIHSPNYLKLSWASLIFNCHLISLDASYTLFKPDGTPLRAKASVSFEGFIDEKTLALKEKRESPDLTHIIVFKSGDTLPNLCFKTYGNPAYYREVAEANQIIHYRNIQPGTKLFFPPIKK